MNYDPDPTAEEILKSQVAGKSLQARRTATTDRITSAAQSPPQTKQHGLALLAGVGLLFIMLVAVVIILVM